jgi:hypothetical protein
MRAETVPPQVGIGWDLKEAQRFLEALDPTASRFTFQMLNDSGTAAPLIRHCTIDELWSDIHCWNSPTAGMGVFVTINETDLTGRRTSNIVRARAVFVDADEQDAVDRCCAFIESTGARPSAVVSTSLSKAHYYWFIDDLPLSDFSVLQKALINKLGTDPAIKDLPRIMRLPGTLHLKDPSAAHRVTLKTRGPQWRLSSLLEKMNLKGVALQGNPASPISRQLSVDNVVSFPPNPLPTRVDNSPLSAGIDTGHWYEGLAPGEKDACLRALLDNCQDITKSHCRQPWLSILMSVKASGAPRAKEIALEWCQRGGEAFCGDAEFDMQWRSFSPAGRAHNVTVGTLIHYAVERGFDTSPWKVKRSEPNVSWGQGQGRQPLMGGTYSELDALSLLNSWFFVGISTQETAIFCMNEDGSVAHMPDGEFRLRLANVWVQVGADNKRVPAHEFWRKHETRSERQFVFKVDANATPGEYNLWRGFALRPQRGWSRQRRLLRHIREIICRRNKEKFKYLMRWLAWSVQKPSKLPGTIVVLKSRVQGTGKSTLGSVMCDIFGSHGRRVDDKDQLLGQFNAELETACFILAEEVLWAGDLKTSDKVKSRITSETIPLEAKYRQRREVPNRMHVMMTTNHDHAVAAGIKDRRFFVLDVSDEHAQNQTWFRALYGDLDAGGREEFLWLLQSLRLEDWHPRQLTKTEESVEQQRHSGDSVAQWSQACIDADAIIGAPLRVGEKLAQYLSTEVLREAYAGYCQQQGVRAVGSGSFGKALRVMFGPRQRSQVDGTGKRPWGYFVQAGDDWQKALDHWLGIDGV